MPRTAQRGGPATRARISLIASQMFLDRGFDTVTVAEVAREAGVSSVTVFKHFPRKEDLLLDRTGEAEEALRSAVRDRGDDVDVTTALHEATLRLLEGREPLSALAEGPTQQFFRTIADSPALLARAREIATDFEAVLAEELERDDRFDGDPALFAAFFVSGYASVMVRTARGLIAGRTRDELAVVQRERIEALFAALRHGVG